jgi:hypothetical protein
MRMMISPNVFAIGSLMFAAYWYARGRWDQLLMDIEQVRAL